MVHFYEQRSSAVEILHIDPTHVTRKVVQATRNPNLEPLKIEEFKSIEIEAELAAAIQSQPHAFEEQAISRLFPNIDPSHDSETRSCLREAAVIIGQYAFAFPGWRLPAMRTPYNGGELPSMFERHGFAKVRRPTDTRTSSTEGASEDWLGSGYQSQPGTPALEAVRSVGIDPCCVSVEYRRTYPLISIDGVGSALIRNSSYYFGRDRFRRAAYMSEQALTPPEADTLCPEMLDGESPRMEAVFGDGNTWDLSRAQKLRLLLSAFRVIDDALFSADNIVKDLSERMAASPSAPPAAILGVFDAETPNWSPLFSLRATPEILAELRSGRMKDASPAVAAFIAEAAKYKRSVRIMSSVNGDLPFGKRTETMANPTFLIGLIQSKVKKELAELGVTNADTTLFPNIRNIDIPRTMENITRWLAETVRPAPGLVVSLSGTDSMLTFLLCSKALRSLKRDPQRELIGLHFRSHRSDSYPYEWLAQHGSVQSMEPPVAEPVETDIRRWAEVQSFAIRNGRLWMIGSRNATETHTGEYSIASNCCSVFPLATLLKTEVLNACHALGVPVKELNESLANDPECFEGCALQNRKVIAMDYFVLDDQKALPGSIAEGSLNPELRALYEKRSGSGTFRKAYQRFFPAS
jgi:hypothetical protein